MTALVEKADQFVLDLFKEKLPNTFIYHNYKHSQRVFKSSKEILENSQIDVKQQEAVLLAAWLHDTGYVNTYKGHEVESQKIAEAFLRKNNADENLIKTVSRCILATRFSNQNPTDELEKIIKDADTSHFGKDYFEETSEFLRQELKLRNIKNYSHEEWVKSTIEVLTKKHRFFTGYALKNWQNQKDENLLWLLDHENSLKKKLEKEDAKARLKAKYKNQSPDRGVQTLFRVTMRNHLKLSDIADTKANILLSVNAIIVSLALSNLIHEIDEPESTRLMIPTLILLFFSVASIIGAILSTRPNVTHGEFTREQVQNREVNLLFFGNFHKMPYNQFKWAIDEIIKDQDFLYDSLIKDLYLLGIVLNRKYRLLRITYTIFMIGIIVSVLAFIYAYYLL